MMKQSTHKVLANLFLALSDGTRLRLLALIANGEVSVGFLADKLGESQPKVSRHLAYLRNAGLVSTRREGKWVYYVIKDQLDAAATRVLDATLRSIVSDGSIQKARPEIEYGDDSYRSYDSEPAMSSEQYTDNWTPAEIEIFLL
jgi:ArsR family transcriptional regulator, arsenate/arsenite/antimonite-responsive transcriptional repressor